MPGARMRRRKKARMERAEGQNEGEDAQMESKNVLFDDDDDEEEDGKLQVNEKYVKRFEHNEKLKDKMRLKELEQELPSDSSDTEEDENAELLTEEVDMLILDTMARIKKKDPRIYDTKTKFFDEIDKDDEEDDDEDGENKKQKKEKARKKFTVTDYEREQLLKGKLGAESDEDDEEDMDEDDSKLTYAEQQNKLKQMFKDDSKKSKKKDKKEKQESSDSGSDDELFRPRSKTNDEKKREDFEYQEFAKERLAEKNPTQTLATLLKDGDLDADELWLRQYVLGNEWRRDEEATPSYGQIIGDDSEADEEDVKRQEDFEEAYNFRFEQKGSENIIGHARKIDNSVRREESKRKEKRHRKQERAEAEMNKKKEELQRLKNVKKQEIYDRLKKIQELSKAKDIGADVIDLEADFDPEEHDKKMAQLYNEDYYEEGEMEHPFIDEADDEFLQAIGWEEDDGEYDEEGEYGEEGGDGEEQGGDGHQAKKKEKKKSKKEEKKEQRDAARKEKKKGKNLTEEELEGEVKKVSGFQQYLDEYYNLDFEGMAGDVPTRFKYRETEALDVGLTPEEILALDDADLKQVMPISYFGAPFKSIPPKLLKSLKEKAKKMKRELHENEGDEEAHGQDNGEADGEPHQSHSSKGGDGKKGAKRDKWGNKIAGGGERRSSDGASGGGWRGGDAGKGGGWRDGQKKDKEYNKSDKNDWKEKRGEGREGEGKGGDKSVRSKEGKGRHENAGKRGREDAGIEQDRLASYKLPSSTQDQGDKGWKKKGSEEERDKKKRKYEQAHRMHAGEHKPKEGRKAFKGDGEAEGKPSRLIKFDD